MTMDLSKQVMIGELRAQLARATAEYTLAHEAVVVIRKNLEVAESAEHNARSQAYSFEAALQALGEPDEFPRAHDELFDGAGAWSHFRGAHAVVERLFDALGPFGRWEIVRREAETNT